MRTEAMDGVESGEGEDDDSTVRSASYEDVGDGVELKLADEGSVALQEGKEFTVEQNHSQRRCMDERLRELTQSLRTRCERSSRDCP